MALQKNIEQITGVISNYHYISKISIDRKNQKIRIDVKSFISDQTRLANKANTLFKSFEFPFSDVSLTVTQAYNLLKTDPYFSGAIDC